MHVLVINFSLKGMTDSEFRAMSDEVAPAFAAVPGLVSKTWLADAGSNTYGGVYMFASKADCDAYLASELCGVVKNHPNFASLTARDFGVLEGPSEVTRGLFVPALSA